MNLSSALLKLAAQRQFGQPAATPPPKFGAVPPAAPMKKPMFGSPAGATKPEASSFAPPPSDFKPI